MAKKRGSYKSKLRGYEAYSYAYDEMKRKRAAKGFTMARAKMSKSDWEKAYRTEKTYREADVIYGNRKTVGDVNRALIKRETYHATQAQAKAQQQILRKQGKSSTLAEIRGGAIEPDWEAIEKRRMELNDQYGLSEMQEGRHRELSKLDKAKLDEINHIISQEYFYGSK